MDARFGQYPRFYVQKKSVLFPLIEKYSGESLRGKTHGEVISLYTGLLRTDAGFKAEVDNYISGHYKNAVAAIISNVLGSLFGGGNDDTAFAQAVLEQQKAKNTQTILIVGGITVASIALIGVGIYLAVKKKRG